MANPDTIQRASMMTRLAEKLPSEFRNGLPTLVTAFVAIYWMSLIVFPTVVLVKPIEQAWGWNRSEATLMLSSQAFVTLLFGHLAGSVAERFGLFRTAFVGTICSAAALLCVGLSGPNLALWYAAWALFGLTQLFCTVIVWSHAISQCFQRQRGLALAIAISGSALSAATMPSMTLWLYDFLGIGSTYVAFAGLMLVTTLPLIALTRKRFQPLVTIEPNQPQTESGGITLRAAIRTRAFWLMAAGMPIVAGAVSSIIIHSHSLMTDSGLSVQDATWVTSLLGPALLIGRLLTGRLLDRLTARKVIMGVFLFPAIACAILATFNGSLMLAVIATLCAGVAAGAEGDMLAYFTSRYFGVRHYGQIYGILLGLFSVGYGAFPPAVGLLFDIYGSYNYAFAFVGGMLIVGVMLLYFIGDYPEGAAHNPK